MIPQTFDSWKACLVEACGIALTPEFAAERLSVYLDRSNPETQKFAALYGEHHLNNIIAWFQQV
ncbi:hypothetical protein [Fluviicola sp.]|uniref:hypothetical protein n=1 Tax=Fluviicola sp. TaxID=1917219 RepID=UPI0031CF0743